MNEEDLKELCQEVGLFYEVYHPTDDFIRYRIFLLPAGSFFSSYGLFTACSIESAIAFIAGYTEGANNKP